MASVIRSRNGLSVKAYRGDFRTLLAFNMSRQSTRNLAGFTIRFEIPGDPQPKSVFNNLRFEKPANHAQVATEPAISSVNAPIHKFRWVHVPGSVNQEKPKSGIYKYTVTPRFFDGNRSMLPLDPDRSVTVAVQVGPFTRKALEVAFTRGYTQSQAFVRHFGIKAKIEPAGNQLQFDTSQQSGVSPDGKPYTFADEYQWLGFTARETLFGVLNDVLEDKKLTADVFAYDLNEPDLIGILLKLAGQKRVRVILDNATLHHNKEMTKPEDKFEKLFTAAAGATTLIKRGKFGRFAHDKVVVVRSKATGKARKVLTGSTNFSVTGLYVNSNHILVFNDPVVAQQYADVFQKVWETDVKKKSFVDSPLSVQSFDFSSVKTPKTSISFAPHDPAIADQMLKDIADRITKEGNRAAASGSVLFAVMELAKGVSPVLAALKTLHSSQDIFSYGISDSDEGISLYPLGRKTGVLVTGKPTKTRLPKPFNQVRNLGGFGHQVHHKFVVCGFNGPEPVVFCGSSNLAGGGEANNGDNLLAIFDEDVATCFAIEALSLVDHFDFLNRVAEEGGKPPATPAASKPQAAADAEWFLSTTDKWVEKFFDPEDLHCVDRKLFGP